MKTYERDEARRLRREQGMSVKEICRTLGVAKSSVSVWVRDIELTEEQQKVLTLRRPFAPGAHKGAITNRNKGLEQRRQYQEQGRIKARERDPLHMAGCMLYWAEGSKSKSMLEFPNSDADMMVFYIKFLRESLQINDTEITVRIACYLGNGISVEEIEDYWLNLLSLPESSLRKTLINVQPRSSQQKDRKLKYGMCKLSVYRTQSVQHVFGAIQEYVGIDKPKWLF
jgi:predicted transcriptional regulator